MKPLLLIILISLAQLSQAQDGYSNGYYITYGQDTTFTKIKVFNSQVGKKIGYVNHKGKRKKFNADEISEYSIEGLSSYATIAPFRKAPKVRFFAEIVVDGKARLLFYAFKKKYFLKRQGSAEAIKIKKLSYRKQLMHFFQDFDDLREALKKKTYKYGQIETVVTKYNTWYVEFYLPYQESLK